MPSFVYFSSDHIQTYRVILTCGITLIVNASLSSTNVNGALLFKYDHFINCFLQIPGDAVESVSTLEESLDLGPLKGDLNRVNNFFVRLPTNQVLLIMTHEKIWAKGDAVFCCHQRPFVRIKNAGKCKFGRAAWGSTIEEVNDPIQTWVAT